MSVTPASVVLTALGDTVRLTAEVRDQHGEVMAGTTVSWTSSDTSVATVDASGLVAAAGDGAATITATAGQATGSAAATVEQVVSTVTVLPAAHTLARGDTLRLGARAEDANGNPMEGAAFVWTSGDESVATVDPEGLVRALRPGTAAITAAVDTVSGSANITVESSADRPALAALYEVTGGTHWTNSDNWLTEAPIEEWHGVGADSVGRVTALDLGGNGLSGQLPEELGQLPALTELKIADNDLSGPLPQSLTSLRLRTFHYADTELCTPIAQPFQEWLGTISSHDGTGLACESPDREILVALYEATGGTNWTNRANWLTDAPVEAWHGVGADSVGRVTALDLGGNGLSGQLPEELGRLPALAELRIGDNDLSGPLPQSLTSLRLRTFHYADTGLCTPLAPAFQEWLGTISSHDGTGLECEPPTDREILVALYEATGGPYWTENGRWLTDAPLHQWHGVQTGSDGRVTGLWLDGNGLRGSLPPELGHLAELMQLRLQGNDLRGPIPPGIGDLSRLIDLRLSQNGLTGPIPPELGDLSSLSIMYIGHNALTGSIPPQLGNLAQITVLGLNDTGLSGPVPPELGTHLPV